MTLLLTILIFALLMTGMAIGVILNKKPLKGSCGGMSALGLDLKCDICGGDTSKCERTASTNTQQQTNKTQYYDPMRE